MQNTDFTKPLVLGDRSIITSYATRLYKWNSIGTCINLVDKLEPALPAPDHVIYLNTDSKTLMQRLKGRIERNYGKEDETPERILQVKKAYEAIRHFPIERLKKCKWHLIDGNSTEEKLFEQAVEVITNLLRLKQMELSA